LTTRTRAVSRSMTTGGSIPVRTVAEPFGDWWGRQDTEARNVWLRTMGFQLTFENRTGLAVTWHLDFGDLKRFEEYLRFGKSLTEAVSQLTGREV
jgi:site-specific DNA recombinase